MDGRPPLRRTRPADADGVLDVMPDAFAWVTVDEAGVVDGAVLGIVSNSCRGLQARRARER